MSTRPATEASTRADSPNTREKHQGRLAPHLLIVTLLALAAEVILLYGRSIATNLIGDDWVLLDSTSGDLGSALGWHGNYHYNPIPQFVLFVEYKMVGINAIAYHAVDLLLVWLSACMVFYLAWRLTGRLGIGILSAILFVANGRAYEVPIWSIVGVLQTLGLLFYCAGLLLYIRSRNEVLPLRARRWAYTGFLVMIALGPFVYEQGVTLVAACFLYRLLVLEHGEGFGRGQLMRRLRGWVLDFWLPVLIFACYLGFKALLSSTGSAQAPGLSESTHTLTTSFTLGIADAFIPGIGLGPLQHLDLFLRQAADAPRIGVLLGLAELALLTAIAVRSGPLARFLIAWTIILVASMTLGLGLVSSRHLFLIVTPTVMLWAMGLARLTEAARRLLARFGEGSRAMASLRYLPAALLVVAYVICGAQYALLYQQAWGVATQQQDRLVAQIDGYLRQNPAADTLYLADLPDSDPSPTGEHFNILYVFRNSPEALMHLRFPGRLAKVTAVATRTDVFSVNPLVSRDQLAQWSREPRTLVLQYDADHMIQWNP